MSIWVLLAITFGIAFVITFILSLFGLDMDMEVDFGMGDFFSFKGLIHFGLGFTLTVALLGGNNPFDYGYGIVVGVLFMILVYLLYSWMDKLESGEPEPISNMVGKYVFIHEMNEGTGTGMAVYNNTLTEFNLISRSGQNYMQGTNQEILSVENNILYIN